MESKQLQSLKNWTFVAVCLLVFLLAVTALVGGGPWLETPTVLFSIPLGNFLAWVMAFSLPLSAWPILRDSHLRWPVLVLVAMGALWLPVSILLAGNVYLNYSGGMPLIAWHVYTGLCVVLPLVLIAGWMVAGLVARFR
jgi:hypothetical protein